VRTFWENLPLRTKTLAVVAVPIIPVLVSVVLMLVAVNRERQAEEWVSHTLEVKAQIESTLQLTADANSSVQAFLLTRDRESLAPFLELGKQWPDTIAGLVRLVRDNPQQVARLKEIAALQGKNPLMSMVQYAAAHGTEPVPRAVLEDNEHTVAVFRDVLSGMQRVEDQLLQQRIADQHRVQRLQEIVSLIGASLTIAATVVVALAFSAGFSRRIYHMRENALRLSKGSALVEYSGPRHDEIGSLDQALRDADQLLRARGAELESRMAELNAVNQELEAFSYSVSHDLRAPLRHITGFASLLESTSAGHLDPEDRRRLKTISEAASRMGRLIDDLLSFSRMGRQALSKRRVRLDDIVKEARKEVTVPGSDPVAWDIQPLPEVEADPAMLHLVFVNLMSNAVKYTHPGEQPRVEIGANDQKPDETVVFVRDHGVGFDMQYAHKLFGVFQRLHSADQFEGTGIGLANVRRIIHRHGGRTWAEGAIDAGATFYFSLPHGEHA
jgi:signal transduction histidine kinase